MSTSTKLKKVFYGNIIYSNSPTDLVVLSPGCIGIDHTGTIAFLVSDKDADLVKLKAQYHFTDAQVTTMTKEQFLIPGFIDTHIHAPQYVFTGTGYDLPLLQWLEKYTFPREAAFKDEDYARAAYIRCVARTLRCGTTTACYYATIHVPGCKILTDIVHQIGQRAFIGKVNMDRNSPDNYRETTGDSIEATTEFVSWLLERKDPLITPVITPRFAPSCTGDLMKFLGEISAKHNLPIQTHLSENTAEIKWVLDLHPEFSSYTGVYEGFGLLNSRSVLAHCVYLTPEEKVLIKSVEAGISHCPNSNFLLQSGVLNVRQLLEAEIKVGLGTDVAGGYSPSILDSIRNAVIASKVIFVNTRAAKEEAEAAGLPPVRAYEPLTLAEVFYLGTLGGAEVMNLDDKIGNFSVGKDFDALLVDLNASGSTKASNLVDGNKSVDLFPHDDLISAFEKFVYNGDDRNLIEIYVKGKQVSGSAGIITKIAV
ncbi:guanine deaminase [Synchytrium microbalum]|uniref:Guanine deaminase n=1 Tax=Synchytrium microbalum TaxID=1806994 RepID=A0A507C792_9FUNG|nr:guanine deaminase [Synchytrium microbalum]TPX35482.1 guanine deaminase [Synchytrium microbalum]